MMRFCSVPATLISLSVGFIIAIGLTTMPTSMAEADEDSAGPTLGPAAAIDLTSGKQTSLRLHVEEDRLAWGDLPQQRVYSTGYVHIGKVLSALLQGASFVEEKENLQQELLNAQERIISGLERVQDRMDSLSPDDSEYQEVAQEGQALLQERERFMQQANGAHAMLAAEHVERAYRELVDAVNVVADRMEIDVVERFIPTDDSFEVPPGPQALNAAMLQIRLRALLRYPESSDITDEVLEELGLE